MPRPDPTCKRFIRVSTCKKARLEHGKRLVSWLSPAREEEREGEKREEKKKGRKGSVIHFFLLLGGVMFCFLPLFYLCIFSSTQNYIYCGDFVHIYKTSKFFFSSSCFFWSFFPSISPCLFQLLIHFLVQRSISTAFP